MGQTNITTREEFVRHLESSKKLTLMVTLTRACVLQCRYCYVRNPNHVTSGMIMSDDLLEKLISDSFDVRHEYIDFEWTGGEALLGGKAFFEKVIALQKKHARNCKTYSNCIQTSGALYDESLYNYLIDNGFTLSLTIDGPRDLHEFNRPSNDPNAFDNILKSYNFIREHTGRCGVLCTLTRASINRLKDIINFYNQKGINNWYTNTYVCDLRKPVSEQDMGLTPDEIESYFKNQFDYLVEKNDHSFGEGSIETVMKLLTGLSCPTKCSQSARCLSNFIAIDNEGNATLCPKFTGYAEFTFGNIRNTALKDLISHDNPVVKRLIDERLAAVNECEKEGCPYFALCKAGCPYYSYLSKNDGRVSHRSILCKAKHGLYEHVDRRLQSHGIKTMTSINPRTTVSASATAAVL